MSESLKALARKIQKAREEALNNLSRAAKQQSEEQQSILDSMSNVKRRLTGSGDAANISKRVLTQLSRSERAYKGWETRRNNKEQDNGNGTTDGDSESL
jgi:hypothetical protein